MLMARQMSIPLFFQKLLLTEYSSLKAVISEGCAGLMVIILLQQHTLSQ